MRSRSATEDGERRVQACRSAVSRQVSPTSASGRRHRRRTIDRTPHPRARPPGTPAPDGSGFRRCRSRGALDRPREVNSVSSGALQERRARRDLMFCGIGGTKSDDPSPPGHKRSLSTIRTAPPSLDWMHLLIESTDAPDRGAPSTPPNETGFRREEVSSTTDRGATTRHSAYTKCGSC